MIEDPLKLQQDLQVTDVSTARFALKIANENHFAIVHMQAQTQKELRRSEQEMQNQILSLVQMYVFVLDSQGLYKPISYIPEPLPATVPESVKAGINYLRAQFELEKERAAAELAEESEPLYEIINYLENLVAVWFNREINAGAAWLIGNTLTLGGATMTLENGIVEFEYKELDYE